MLSKLHDQGYQTIIGVDEVGRGALAGPIIVVATQITTGISGVADSKQIPKKRRTLIARELKRYCSLIRFGHASNSEIDRFGVSQALKLAYARALNNLEADIVLTDHYDLPTRHRYIRATKGDSLFFPVAAASIIAKTYRDQLMTAYHHFFPDYDWAGNAGYGTEKHIDAIRKLGQSPLHRRSFMQRIQA